MAPNRIAMMVSCNHCLPKNKGVQAKTWVPFSKPLLFLSFCWTLRLYIWSLKVVYSFKFFFFWCLIFANYICVWHSLSSLLQSYLFYYIYNSLPPSFSFPSCFSYILELVVLLLLPLLCYLPTLNCVICYHLHSFIACLIHVDSFVVVLDHSLLACFEFNPLPSFLFLCCMPTLSSIFCCYSHSFATYMYFKLNPSSLLLFHFMLVSNSIRTL